MLHAPGPSLSLLLAGAVALTACKPSTASGPSSEPDPMREALRQVRPTSPLLCRHRACTLWQAGQLQQARHELLMALGLDDEDAETRRLLGLLEQRLGYPGAAMRHLQASLEAEPEQPRVRQKLASLLLRRARFRLDRDTGVLQPVGARADALRALELDPSVRDLACGLRARAAGLEQTLKQPGAREELQLLGGAGPDDCPGPPPDLGPVQRRWRHSRCGLSAPGGYLVRLQRRHPLVACQGAQLAVRLEANGCLAAAYQVWEALRQEAPEDPRWPLQLARHLVLAGRVLQARMYLTSHTYLSADRARAMLRGARMMFHAGQRGRAARAALESMSFARGLDQQLEAVLMIRRCGLERQARQAAQEILRRGWDLPPERLQSRLQAVMGRPVAPQTHRP